jgi:hypothetical protein
LIKVFGFLLRWYSYAFHAILCLFTLAVAAIAVSSHSIPKFGFLPFTDETMIRGLFTLAIVGLVSVFLAVTGLFRYMFPVWAAIVLWLMVKGFFLSPFTFPNADAFRGALWLTFGAVGAFFGALWVLKPRKAKY